MTMASWSWSGPGDEVESMLIFASSILCGFPSVKQDFTSAGSKQKLSLCGAFAKISPMTDFLKNIWGFVRPYRKRFFLGLVCGIFYGASNALLIGTINVVMQLTFRNETNLHQKLENAPHWIRPLAHWLSDRLPEIHAPASMAGWALVVGAIPAVMLLRITLAYLSIYLMNWSAMHAIADV